MMREELEDEIRALEDRNKQSEIAQKVLTRELEEANKQIDDMQKQLKSKTQKIDALEKEIKEVRMLLNEAEADNS